MSQEKIDHHKEQFAASLAHEALLVSGGNGFKGLELEAALSSLFMDAIEFGIQLGGMGMELKK